MGGIAKAFGDDPVPVTATADKAKAADAANAASLNNLIQAIRANLTPYEQAQLDAARATTPGYNDLALGELERTAPRIAAVQGQLDAGQAAADIANLNKYGTAAGEALRATDASANPEYYAGLGTLGDKFQDSLNAWSPGLSAGQRAEVERGAARLNPGAADNSAVNTAEKAMQFGTAQQNHLKDFSAAINGAAAVLPTLKTGLNPTAAALGRDSRSAPTAAAISPVKSPSNTVPGLAGNMWSSLLGSENQNNQLIVGKFKDWGDTINQDTSSFANISSGARGFGGG